MQSEVGEMLNTYFIDPVSRTVSSPGPDAESRANITGLSRLLPNHQTPNLYETNQEKDRQGPNLLASYTQI